MVDGFKTGFGISAVVAIATLFSACTYCANYCANYCAK